MTQIQIKKLCLDYSYYSNGFGLLNKQMSYQNTVRALNNIDIHLKAGDSLGLIGQNGSGKSTLLKAMAGVLVPSYGNIEIEGNVSSLLSIQAGFNPKGTGFENIYLKGYFLGWSKPYIQRHIEDIIEFSGLGDDIYRPLHTYSSGMKVRLAFAIVTTGSPDIVLMDEWIGVADKAFSDSAQKRLSKLINNAGILVLASHNEKLISQHTNKFVRLEAGEIIERGNKL